MKVCTISYNKKNFINISIKKTIRQNNQKLLNILITNRLDGGFFKTAKKAKLPATITI